MSGLSSFLSSGTMSKMSEVYQMVDKINQQRLLQAQQPANGQVANTWGMPANTSTLPANGYTTQSPYGYAAPTAGGSDYATLAQQYAQMAQQYMAMAAQLSQYGGGAMMQSPYGYGAMPQQQTAFSPYGATTGNNVNLSQYPFFGVNGGLSAQQQYAVPGAAQGGQASNVSQLITQYTGMSPTALGFNSDASTSALSFGLQLAHSGFGQQIPIVRDLLAAAYQQPTAVKK